jgi:hypothetical protein
VNSAKVVVVSHDSYLKDVITRYGTLHVERVLNEVKTANEVPMRPRIGPAQQGESVYERRANVLAYLAPNPNSCKREIVRGMRLDADDARKPAA